MANKANILNKHVKRHASRGALHETVRLHLGFVLLGMMCLAVSLLSFPMFAILPRVKSKRIGRELIAATFRAYLRFLVAMGACRFDLAELDALRDGPAMIIAPNHPS